jgi:uncharacterized protein
MDILAIIGIIIVALFLFAILFVFVGVGLIILFWNAQKIILPRLTLFIISTFELPIKKVIRFFKINLDDTAFTNVEVAKVDIMIAQLRTMLNKNNFKKTEIKDRAIFIPQCLRSPRCPAPTLPEGLQCIRCGKCGIYLLKDECEKLGYRFFIAPGGTLIKRMVKKYKPRAVLGVGCPHELKEGTALMEAYGMPAIGVQLKRDGCYNTRIDVKEFMDAIYLGIEDKKPSNYDEIIKEIESKWQEQEK